MVPMGQVCYLPLVSKIEVVPTSEPGCLLNEQE